MKIYRLFSLLSLGLLVAMLFGLGASPVLAGGLTFTVNGAGDGGDANIGNGICATATGKCTMRAAIQEANSGVDINVIEFNLPGTGIRRISLTHLLPKITNPVFIDGTTQPGCSAPCVELDGAALSGTTVDGLTLQTSGSTIQGLVITGFYSNGIKIQGDDNIVRANFIGLRPGDALPHPNGEGIRILGSFNLVGGYTAVDRNVISGNNLSAILVGGGVNITDNTIKGNYLGLTPAGTAAMGNGLDGVNVQIGAVDTVISRNVISGNEWHGINLLGSYNGIYGNYIGTKADGTGSLGNGINGISIYGQSTGNYIGSILATDKNRIAHNAEDGIHITADGTGITQIRRNMIFANGQQGIDLGMDGWTPNDAMDVDTGPNDFQNFPIIVSANGSTEELVIKLYSKASTTYKIELFTSPAGTCDPGNHGEGKQYIGTKTLTTDISGFARGRYTSPVGFVPGSVITAVAIDPLGNTSEFSACKTAQ